jgi:hypothetical protein
MTVNPQINVSSVFCSVSNLFVTIYDKKNTVSQLNDKQRKKQTNSAVLVRKRTIPTERPPHVGEVSANFFG